MWQIIAEALGDRAPMAIDRLEGYYRSVVMGDDMACTGDRDGWRGAQECHSAALALAAYTEGEAP